ncbi:hypothetical protein AYJ54_07685 [Bradyrhizobium centrolobii]|uniref:Uncharacterized protein n=1 Tax=Bradyrhizobium centrolobii TaxID=1505087 RepID=A0A176YVL9_9BRAD|nr:hypothetical protein [Bradyrhizobium centrolobii]OAF11738.1 hypothetical protein AYJ54_07685 [Bradyrhizobium centrolobii]
MALLAVPATAQSLSSARCALDSRALTFLKLGNLDAAIANDDAPLMAKPQLDSALYGRGLAKRKKRDADGAERAIAAANTINAGIADAFDYYDIQSSSTAASSFRARRHAAMRNYSAFTHQSRTRPMAAALCNASED